MKGLNKTSSIPLYIQLKEILIEYIENNMTIGEILPTEKELEQIYGVSRMTVRNAIDELQQIGVVTKQQGRGTFVNQNKMTQDVGTIFSWSEEMGVKQKESTTLETTIQEVEPSRKVRESLKLVPGEKVIMVSRVRAVNEEPIVIMTNYLKSKCVPGLEKNGLSSGSLYKDLEEIYGVFLEHAEEVITARSATAYEAAKLNIPEEAAILHVRRTSFIKNRIPVEVVDMLVRGDRYEYFVELDGRKKKHIIS
ncbi:MULTISPECIES: GntR family transcriptional regulator [Enterococcus]|uniref:GntR family transcriptional regulator n=1 Tax=Enterococcus TaxID=1350 RepID=UPI0010F7F5DD|nr:MULTISPECIES: GntR family transcriptional regulator [Enterococcus]MDT2681307.1 GntR family transcriptional regulator [Enterococcus gallinarum]